MPQINCGTKPRRESWRADEEDEFDWGDNLSNLRGGNLNNGGDNDEDQIKRVNESEKLRLAIVSRQTSDDSSTENIERATELMRGCLEYLKQKKACSRFLMKICRIIKNNPEISYNLKEETPRDWTRWSEVRDEVALNRCSDELKLQWKVWMARHNNQIEESQKDGGTRTSNQEIVAEKRMMYHQSSTDKAVKDGSVQEGHPEGDWRQSKNPIYAILTGMVSKKDLRMIIHSETRHGSVRRPNLEDGGDGRVKTEEEEEEEEVEEDGE
ncbi:hypothetical protein BY996DRAFT_6595633 [Phakopsora pachyrhizi]|nr:hypothetical protein BY996DRAFT_6595633 [Phakopsora pachyrhizi]